MSKADISSTSVQEINWIRASIKHLPLSSDSMAQILPQTKFQVIPPKDVGEVAFLAETDASCQVLGFCRDDFSSLAHMALILKFLESQ